jgi:hypothetical protein
MLCTLFQVQTPVPNSSTPRPSNCQLGSCSRHEKTCLLAVCVEEGLEVDDVGVGYQSHDLQFSVLKSAMSLEFDIP